MRVAAASVSLLLSLTACGNTAFIPHEVKIPITQRCDAKTPDEPEYNLPKLLPGASLVDKSKALLADLELYKGYVIELKATIAACQP